MRRLCADGGWVMKLDQCLSFAQLCKFSPYEMSVRMRHVTQRHRERVQSESQSINQSINRLNNQSINQSINANSPMSPGQSIDDDDVSVVRSATVPDMPNHSINQSINQSNNRAINRSLNQSINQPNQSINQAVKQQRQLTAAFLVANPSFFEWTKPELNRDTHSSINQSINQSVKLPIYHLSPFANHNRSFDS